MLIANPFQLSVKLMYFRPTRERSIEGDISFSPVGIAMVPAGGRKNQSLLNA
jgi:hypothetical protein